ncbi:hypothetical protein MT325_m402L [Paramecium bursaria chlorella virus MT325]|uniref:Uncharacterized protein m402L n=1 Tax=Paramecium bursaria Chlorella virus MT325 TaxID=346932 RepID=A7IUD2_PBCVM|nr:hypothetical protein MT325_m402L [Paramecium bursaria chlorella virus MT325]
MKSFLEQLFRARIGNPEESSIAFHRFHARLESWEICLSASNWLLEVHDHRSKSLVFGTRHGRTVFTIKMMLVKTILGVFCKLDVLKHI